MLDRRAAQIKTSPLPLTQSREALARSAPIRTFRRLSIQIGRPRQRAPARIIIDSSTKHGLGGRPMAAQTNMGAKTSDAPTGHDDFAMANRQFNESRADPRADVPPRDPPPLIREG